MKIDHTYKSRRNSNINYSNGCFFVTIQVAHNLPVLGAIVGEKCILNELGKAVKTALLDLPQKHPELELGQYTVMPNHLHAIFFIKRQITNRKNHLGFLIGRFKGATAFIYGKLKQIGRVPDIGKHLWQNDYWENLVSSAEELRNIDTYIRENAKNWSKARWQAVTTYTLGETMLLNLPKRAFVASQGPATADFVPRRIFISEAGTLVPPPTQEFALISTFTSRQEREVLRRALHKKQRIIHVCPQGIPPQESLSPEQQLALAEKRLLFISPQAPGAKLNKKIATWCNEYVLRHAVEIWVGHLSPNGMLATLMKGLRQESINHSKIPRADTDT